MTKLKLILSCFLASLFLFASCDKKVTTANYNVIPLPQKIEEKTGKAFDLGATTTIVYPNANGDLKRTAMFLSDYLMLSTGLSLTVTDEVPSQNNYIELKADLENKNKEAYSLIVEDKKITINGATAAGTFYGVQTLRKSIDGNSRGNIVLLPQVNIVDYPRFDYRGMMLDVSRHFYTVDFVKKYIDILALHNINTFHWHLTDDQGWRIEIKKYPKLTEIGSKRKETVIGKNTGKYDNTPHGGFYTQEEAKEIVKYAQERFITVIPEVDLPGHMLAALTVYPELGCTGGPYEVATTWGVFDDVLCMGNDNTMEFLKDVFGELIEIFPSQYIHVGGDECPKTRWESCKKCKDKIKALKLKKDKVHSAEDKLQSYAISTIAKFLNRNGRQIIGWDEILDGGVAPNATVMSWRGEKGGIAAARQGHNVIMTPNTYLYFDYYQTKNTENEPFSIGGYVPLCKVYNYDPIPSDLTAEQKTYIKGVQANLWSEYISNSDHAEYMVLPRMAALADVQWSEYGKKDYTKFLNRLLQLVSIYDVQGYNYSTRAFDLESKVILNEDTNEKEIVLTTVGDSPIYYTLNGSEPTKKSTKYEGPIAVKKDLTLKAIAIHPKFVSPMYSHSYKINKSTLKPIEFIEKCVPHVSYTFDGAATLVDGMQGNENGFKDGSWIGFNGQNIEAIIDLKATTEISTAKVGTYVSTSDWIFGATSFGVEISIDGKSYKKVAKNSYFEVPESQKAGRVNIEAKFTPVQARFVKIYIAKTRKIPGWHVGKGKDAFLFVDEIQVD